MSDAPRLGDRRPLLALLLVSLSLCGASACADAASGDSLEGAAGGSGGTGADTAQLDGTGATGAGVDGCEGVGVDAEDDDDALGFSARDALDLVSKSKMASLRWLPASLDYGPEQGDGVIEVEVERGNGPTRQFAPPVGGLDLYGGPCTGTLETPVRLRVRSGGGAVDEALDATLVTSAPDRARVQVDVPYEALSGSLDLSLAPAGEGTAATATLTLDILFAPHGIFGALTLSRLSTGGAFAHVMLDRLAQFPAERPCDTRGISVPADVDLGGYASTDVLAASAEAMANLQVEWPDSDPSALTATTTHLRTCVDDAWGTRQTLVMIETRLTSADARLDATFESLALVPRAGVDGGLAGAELVQPAGARLRDAAELGTALPGVDATGYDGAQLALVADIKRAPSGWSFEGQLEVLGYSEAACLRQPVAGQACDGGSQTSLLVAPIASRIDRQL